MPRSNVVITGSGVVSSIGIGSDAFFQGLLDGRSGITSLANRTDEGAKPSESDKLAGQWIGGPIVDFDPKQYVRPRKALKVMCREIQTAFAASHMAIDDAGLSESFPAKVEGPVEPKDIGTVFGSEMFYGPPSDMADAIRNSVNEDGEFDPSKFGGAAMKNVMPLWMLKYLPNMPACQVGIALNAHGPNNTLVLGDISGPSATIEAASCIERNIANVMIAGATGTRVNTTRMNYRHDLPLAGVSDPVERSARPHDPESPGVVGGEAAVSLVLESREHAESRGATPMAQLVSYGSCFVASGGMKRPERSNQMEPGVRGSMPAVKSAIRVALQDGSLQPNDVSLVVSHGMGDPVMDEAERMAIAEMVPGVPVVAPIAALGHAGAASGSVGLVTGLLSITQKLIPPTPRTTTTSDVGFVDQPTPLGEGAVLCLSQTSEGSATALVLSSV